MKKLSLFIFCLLSYSVIQAQNMPMDTHPAAQLFAINYQTGQEYPVMSPQAIQFKDALVDLVSATFQSRQILRTYPGRKVAVIKQIDPKKLNGYQLTWQAVIFGQSKPLCTFYYNIDQNALFFYDPGTNGWVNVQITGENMNNLSNCQASSGFNNSNGPATPDLSVNGNQQAVPDMSVNNDQQGTPQDTLSQQLNAEVTAENPPPALPDYDQPDCPADGYLWQPGYWAYSRMAADYYWVPGVWVAPPTPGLYWTPGYWGFAGGIYRFHGGYWGASVGFYGGINYGFGYGGVGFAGGAWRGGVFSYNTAVVHVNTTVVHNTYVNNTVVRNTTVVNHASFNGAGGVAAKPTPSEQAAMKQPHIQPTNEQLSHQQAALNNKSQFASANNGKPAVTTMAKVNPAALNPRGNNNASRNLSTRPNNANGQNAAKHQNRQPKQQRQRKQRK